MAVDLNNIQTGYLGQEGVFKIDAMNINEVGEQEREATRKFFNESEDRAILADGTLVFLDKDGSTQYVPQSKSQAEIDKSMIDESVVKELADLKYIAQNVGASKAEMDAAYEKLGLDTSKSTVFSDADAILRSYGYKPGQQGSSFFGSNTSDDRSVNILVDRWDSKPSDEDLEAAGIDPSSVSIVNDHAANAAYLAEQLIKQGVSLDSTKAPVSRLASASRAARAESNRQIEDLLKNKAPGSYWDKKMSETGLSLDELQLDMLEWDLIKKKKEGTGVDTTGYTSAIGNVNTTGGATTQTGGNITGGATPSVYQGPNFVSTPNISNVSPVMSSGNYEATLPTYEAGIGKQETQFKDRAVESAKLLQPQTLAEKQALAANDPNYTAPAFENVMYRNRFGMTTYIQHINGIPSQPIPPGYYKVESFTDQSQTQAGSAAQGGNQGGLMQGQNQGNVIPRQANIAGQPHRLAYVNPQEEKLLKAAGGAGTPSYGGVPAYFTLGQGTTVGEVATDPSTGTKYTWNGTSWDITLSSGESAGTTTGVGAGVDTSQTGTNGTIAAQSANTVNPALNYQPGGTIIGEGDRFRIQYPDGTMSQLYTSQADAQAANQMGLTNLGLPDYNTYLTNQGIDVNLGGYDEAAFQDAYQSYITDPATLEQIKFDQEQAQQEEVQPVSGTVGGDQPLGETTVTPEDLAQYQANLNAQAFAQPGGAVAASPVAYLDPNSAGTVMPSTTGQALGTAPMVQEDQVAQIGSATQAIGPGYEGLKPMDYANMALEISTGLRDYDPRFDTNGDGTVTSADALAIANGTFQVEQLESEKAYVQPEASQYTANQAYSDVSTATGEMTAATSDGPTKTIDAAQQTGSSLTGLTSATRDSIDVTAPDARTLETIDGQSELITGTGVDQSKVLAAFGEGEIKAASVQDELTGLMQQFEGGNTPAWAAGSMRSAMATLAARGLGASSMAGQAVIQAAMEAALPIAQIDTANKQQVALFKAEQRAKFLQMDFDQAFQAKVMNAAKVSEIANMNFTAEQQIALENSKAANTMQLQNLSNEQALVMAEAAALSQIDMANLNNRQQAAVQNAQNFLQIDMANLSNEQQTATFKQQSLINSILSDQAAANAAAQFNATSENQTNQFFSNLAASVSQFNAAQMNAMKQFNADEVNGLLEFNAALQNQREMFNAQNYLVVAQANAQWRQNVDTINTAAANQSNMEYAKNVNNLTQTALDEIWMRERDLLSMAFQSSENTLARNNAIMLQKLAGNATIESAKLQADIEAEAGASNLLSTVFLKVTGLI